MMEAAAEISPATRPRTSPQKTLAQALWVVVGLHAILLIVERTQEVAASRYLTVAVAVLSTLCVYWRAEQIPVRERPTWRWAGAGMFLWAMAHLVETLLGHSTAASVLAIDGSVFFYFIAAFPLLLALSTTRETATIRTVFFLNITQIGLALVLTYFRLYRMELAPDISITVMGRIYGVACVLLAALSALRLFTWETAEERRGIGLVFDFFCTYLRI